MATPKQQSLNENISYKEATVADTATVSSSIQLNGAKLIAIHFPSGMSSSTYNVQESADGTTWENIYDNSGVQLTVAVTSSAKVYFLPQDVAHISGYVRLAGGTAQSGAVTIQFDLRPL